MDDANVGPLGEPTPPEKPGIGNVLTDVFATLEQRKRDMPEDSYTAKLLAGDPDKLLKKIGEEATEVVMAAKNRDLEELRYEIADLIYHLLVVMVRDGMTLDDLAEELAGRRR
ncbi:MAG: phosphoribosyl-ATP diphosphatase [Coriobacteriia bacterium]|nr:phosphoribosyl-ATP diphosphatase [Coriobacteriia bacterium]